VAPERRARAAIPPCVKPLLKVSLLVSLFTAPLGEAASPALRSSPFMAC